MKESIFNNFSLTIFDFSEIAIFCDAIKEVFKEDFEVGTASLRTNGFEIEKYFNPSIGGEMDEECGFWKTRLYPNKIFFTASIIDGWYTLCNVLHRRLHCNFVQYKFSNVKDYPAYHLHYVGADGGERHILAYKDPRWVFYDVGNPLDYEDLNQYKNRLVRDRLNNKILIEYMKRVGVDFEKIDAEIIESYTFIRKILHNER